MLVPPARGVTSRRRCEAARSVTVSKRDPRANLLFRHGFCAESCALELAGSDFDPMISPTEAMAGNVIADQRLSSALYLLYTVETCQRFGQLGVLLGSTESPLLSGLFGERDRLVRVRREQHTATSHPQREEVSQACHRSIGGSQRFRDPRQRAVSAARDHARYGLAELPSSRFCTRPCRPGEESA